jgi:hypothetical protein
MDHKAKAILTPEEKELFLELKHIDAYKVIIKVLNLLAQEQMEGVLKMDLSRSTDRDLAMAKSRSEGAEKIVRDFHALASKTAKKPADKE